MLPLQKKVDADGNKVKTYYLNQYSSVREKFRFLSEFLHSDGIDRFILAVLDDRCNYCLAESQEELKIVSRAFSYTYNFGVIGEFLLNGDKIKFKTIDRIITFIIEDGKDISLLEMLSKAERSAA